MGSLPFLSDRSDVSDGSSPHASYNTIEPDMRPAGEIAKSNSCFHLSENVHNSAFSVVDSSGGAFIMDNKWSKTEKQIARRAFDLAHDREMKSIANKVKEMANGLEDPNHVWEIEEYLKKQSKELFNKYDFRYSMIPIVLPRLIREGWLRIEELDGFSEDKLEYIRNFFKMIR